MFPEPCIDVREGAAESFGGNMGMCLDNVIWEELMWVGNRKSDENSLRDWNPKEAQT